MARRDRTGARRGGGVGWFERLLFSVMGPPQLGENRPRTGYVADESANLCPRCRETWDVHERVHTGTMTYRRCR